MNKKDRKSPAARLDKIERGTTDWDKGKKTPDQMQARLRHSHVRGAKVKKKEDK